MSSYSYKYDADNNIVILHNKSATKNHNEWVKLTPAKNEKLDLYLPVTAREGLVIDAALVAVGVGLTWLKETDNLSKIPTYPSKFNPKGLIKEMYDDEKIIKWHEINPDGTKGKTIFEWDKDL